MIRMYQNQPKLAKWSKIERAKMIQMDQNESSKWMKIIQMNQN